MSIFGSAGADVGEQMRKTQRPMTAPKDTFDFRQQQDQPIEPTNNNGKKTSGLKTDYPKRLEEPELPQSRKGAAGREIRAAQTTAQIFPRDLPKEVPTLDADLERKIAKGTPLTNDERTAALYHPRLFQQQAVNQMDQQSKPWHIGQDELPFRSTRKLRPHSPTASPKKEDASGDKTKYAFVSMNAQSQSDPQEHHRTRKHVPAPMHEQGPQKPIRKPVAGVSSTPISSINLKLEDSTQQKVVSVQPEVKRFTRKRIDVPQHNEEQPAQPVHGRKMVAPPVNAEPEKPKVFSKKEYPEALKTRCPFGTESNYDMTQARRPASAVHEESMKKDLPRSAGLDISRRPADQRGLLSWS